MNMLYCGMANDISTPFILPIEWNKLYVIDIFDPAFSSDHTLEGQKKDILAQLRSGQRHRNGLWHSLQARLKEKPNSSSLQKQIVEYESKFTPCEIIRETTEGNKWSIFIKQNNKEKEIIIFYANFCKKWPEEIKDITTLTSFGAVFPLSSNHTLNEMIESRCTEDCLFYFKSNALYENQNTTYLFNKIKNDVLSCPVKTHLPLLKYLFVDNENKNNIKIIPKELIHSYDKNKTSLRASFI